MAVITQSNWFMLELIKINMCVEVTVTAVSETILFELSMSTRIQHHTFSPLSSGAIVRNQSEFNIDQQGTSP